MSVGRMETGRMNVGIGLRENCMNCGNLVGLKYREEQGFCFCAN